MGKKNKSENVENRQDLKEEKQKTDVFLALSHSTQKHIDADTPTLHPTEREITITSQGRKEHVARILINFVYLRWECHAGFFGNSPYDNHVRNLTSQAETKLCGRRETGKCHQSLEHF